MWTTGAPGRRASHCATEERESSSHRAVVPCCPSTCRSTPRASGWAGPGFGSGGVVLVAVVALFSLLVFLAADFRAAHLFAVPGPWFRVVACLVAGAGPGSHPAVG